MHLKRKDKKALKMTDVNIIELSPIKEGTVVTSGYANIKITKGFTSGKIEDVSKISLTNEMLIQTTYTGEYPELDKKSFESSTKMVISGCRETEKE